MFNVYLKLLFLLLEVYIVMRNESTTYVLLFIFSDNICFLTSRKKKYGHNIRNGLKRQGIMHYK